MSAAAPALLVETPAYFEASSYESAAKETISDLAHDLRQPLSTIEAIAYFLEMTLPADQLQARQYMRRLQQLVGEAESILHCALTAAGKLPASAGPS